MDEEHQMIFEEIRKFSNAPFKEKAITMRKKVIAHYTDAQAIKGIIDNNEFWASRSDFLNDTTEVEYGWSLLEKIWGKIFKDKMDKSKKEYLIVLKRMINESKRKNTENIFIVSFSKNEDSLAMWSQYSGKDGYRIGVDFRESSKMWARIYGKNWAHGMVVYDIEEQQAILIDQVESGYDLWEKITREEELLSEAAMYPILHRLKIWSVFLKSPYFKQEEEIRVVVFWNNIMNKIGENITKLNVKRFNNLSIPDKLNSENNIAREVDDFRERNKINYRVRGNYFCPYIKVQFDKRSVKSIKIGPVNKVDKAKHGLEEYLKSQGLDKVEVKKSDCPLRF